MWRRPRPRECHAHESYESYDSDRSYEPYESYEPCQAYEPNESYDPNEYHEPGGSGQSTVTTPCMRWSTWAAHLVLAIKSPALAAIRRSSVWQQRVITHDVGEARCELGDSPFL